MICLLVILRVILIYILIKLTAIRLVRCCSVAGADHNLPVSQRTAYFKYH